MRDYKNIGDILHYVKDCAYFANVFNRYNKILYLIRNTLEKLFKIFFRRRLISLNLYNILYTTDCIVHFYIILYF